MPLRPTEPLTVVREFGAVWLWREDLAEIISVMRQASPDLILQADSYTLDEIDDLDGLTEPLIRSFKATSADSRIRLTLGPRAASVSADDPDLPTRGMLEEVHRIATRHSRARYRRMTEGIVLAVAWLGLLTWAGILGDDQGAALPVPFSIYAALTIFGTIIGLSVIEPPRRLAIISAKTRHEAPLWLSRNKDALITNAIVSAVFLVIGVLIGYILPK